MNKSILIFIISVILLIVPVPGNCQVDFPDKIIENLTVSSGSHIFYSPSGIISPSNPSFSTTVSGSADVEFKAAKYVRLKPGFKATNFTNGGRFRAHVSKPFDVVIFSPVSSPGEVPIYTKLELGLKLPESIESSVYDFIETEIGTNPFNPDEISLECFLTSPTGKQKTIYGFYYKEYERNINDDLNADGFSDSTWVELPTDYHWRIRFSPDEIGAWGGEIKIFVNGIQFPVETVPFNFTSTPNTNTNTLAYRGPLEIGNDGKHLRHSGTKESFFAVGENIAFSKEWYTYNPAYFNIHSKAIEELASAGGNFIRLWMPPWGMGIEREQLGNYGNYYIAPRVIPASLCSNGAYDCGAGNVTLNRQMHAWELDQIFNVIENKGLFVMLTLESAGFKPDHNIIDEPEYDNNWNKSDWNTNAYKIELNLSNEPVDFFASVDAKKYYKRKLRYFFSRWGYSTNLAIVEFLNEADKDFQYVQGAQKSKIFTSNFNTDIIDAWHGEMADFILTDLKQNKLLTSSYAISPIQSNHQNVFNVTGLDNTNDHSYHFTREINLKTRFDITQTHLNKFNKPFIWGEIGAVPYELALCNSNSFHNAIWATTFMGGFGTGLHWSWDIVHNVIPNGENTPFYTHYTPISSIMSSVDFESHTFFPERYPATESLINASSGNNGPGTLFPLEAFSMVSTDKQRIIGWVHNRSYYWANLKSEYPCLAPFPDPVDDDYYSAPKPVSGSFIQFSNMLPNTKYDVDFFNTQNGSIVLNNSFTATGSGTLNVFIPVTDDNNPDYAYKIRKSGIIFREGTDSSSMETNNVITNKIIAEPIGVYPNPFNDKLIISIYRELIDNQTTVLGIFNTVGQLVYSENIISEHTIINTNLLKEGIYMLRVELANTTVNTKIVKR